MSTRLINMPNLLISSSSSRPFIQFWICCSCSRLSGGKSFNWFCLFVGETILEGGCLNASLLRCSWSRLGGGKSLNSFRLFVNETILGGRCLHSSSLRFWETWSERGYQNKSFRNAVRRTIKILYSITSCLHSCRGKKVYVIHVCVWEIPDILRLVVNSMRPVRVRMISLPIINSVILLVAKMPISCIVEQWVIRTIIS